MPLTAGSRLGPYEILGPLGAGGMGEVYKARDTRLERTVAVKVLPSHLSSSAESRQRFEREAKTISQLSHPHICALYDVGREGETEYLVMEYLEGETLSERLAKSALPLDQSLRHGMEIADALDKAHRQGFVHRDLKPANVMLTKSGVKLLDFGLAKAILPASPRESLTSLPTQQNLTQEGAILGTFQYMAPEQLEGKEADARTDIFAFGAVLYEMATGKKAFAGTSQASLISAIMSAEPPAISKIQPLSPATLDRVVGTCLAKDPEERWQSAADIKRELRWIAEGSQTGTAAPALRPRRRSAILPWAIAAAGVALAIFAFRFGAGRPTPPRLIRSSLLPPAGTTFHFFGANVSPPALSADGRKLVYGARDEDGSLRLWIQELDAPEAYPVPGGEGGLFPFWSPDGRSIGFFSKGMLRVVEASPSPPPARALAEVVEARGASWGADGTIVYAPENFTALMRVSASGGKPVPATRLDSAAGDLAHRWPRFLPDGRRFLYEARRRTSDPGATTLTSATYLESLDGGERKVILSEATSVMYAPPGYLFFRRVNTFMAVPCDPGTLELRADPVVVASNLEGFAATGMSLFTVSDDLLVFSPTSRINSARIVWLDRSGTELSSVGPAGRFTHVGLSFDGRAAVVAQIEEPSPPDLWSIDTRVGRALRLTQDFVAQIGPILSPDGTVFFSSFSTGPWDIWELGPGGEGKDMKTVLSTRTTKMPNDVSPDGRWLIYREFQPVTRGDLKAVPLQGSREPVTVVATAADETNADFSPDGRWVAYASDESGRMEIYAASFPDPVRRYRVSSEGGAYPRWSRDGKELFYVRSGRLLAAPVVRQRDELTFGEGQPLFSMPLFTLIDPGFDNITRYDVAPDGRFLALLRAEDEAPTPLTIVQNWRHLVGAAKK